MKRYALRILALTGMVMGLLSGCMFRSVDELYAIPQPSKDYEALQRRLSEVIGQGGEYAAPLSGELIQAVQLQDLDSDGNQEAIAFFRFPNEEKPLRIYIFTQRGEEYEAMTVIEHAGTAIDSVDYVQMDDSPLREIVVSWQISDRVRSLTAYAIGPGVAEELLRTDYVSYRLADLDQDNQQELVVFRTPVEGVPQAELYDFREELAMVGTAPLSGGITQVVDGGVRTGYLTGRVPALFAVSTYGENGSITDIFTCQNGELRNVTLDEETGESGETVRFYTQAAERDINGDGIMELPQPIPVMEYRLTGETVSFWLIHWRQFDTEGNPSHVFTTYHNERDGWYFILPDHWGSRVTMSRSDLPGGGERSVTFSYWEGDEAVEPKPFLTIYRLTGSSRVARVNQGQRFLLADDEEDVLYAAEFRDGWDCGLTQEEARERFYRIRTDWYNGN